jgi:hypothetical protein
LCGEINLINYFFKLYNFNIIFKYKMSTSSGNVFTVDGDIDSGRGQLGIAWSGTTTSATLWSLRRGGNRYNINSVTDITITLPVVGTATAQAQPGYCVIISSRSANAITVVNSSAVTVSTISGNSSAEFVADTNVASGWSVIFNTSTYGGSSSSLQVAYDTSAATDPQITLSDTFGAVKVRDSPTPSAALLTLSNTAGSLNYFNVGNAVAGSQLPVITMFGAAVSGAGTQNVLAVGPVTVPAANANGIAFTDTALTMDDCSRSFQTTYLNGSNHYAGATRAATGVAKTSANERTMWISANAVPTAGAIIFTTTMIANATYKLKAHLVGRDVVAASGTSVTHELSAMVVLIASASTTYGNIIQSIAVPGFTNIFSTATFSSSGTTLNLTANAPDNVNGGAGGTMDFRGYVKLTVLVE